MQFRERAGVGVLLLADSGDGVLMAIGIGALLLDARGRLLCWYEPGTPPTASRTGVKTADQRNVDEVARIDEAETDDGAAPCEAQGLGGDEMGVDGAEDENWD